MTSFIDHIMEGSNDHLVMATTVTLLAVAGVTSMLGWHQVLPALWRQRRALARIQKAQEQQPSSNNMGTVQGLFIHPVKSMRAVSQEQASLDDKGFVGDRRFMMVYPLPLPVWKDKWDASDVTHRFFSQRQCPSLATVQATFLNNDSSSSSSLQLTVTHSKTKKKRSISIPVLPPKHANILRVGLWSNTTRVYDMGDQVAAFLQTVVDADDQCGVGDEGTENTGTGSMYQGVRLVCQVGNDLTTKAKYTPPEATTTFTSSCPPVSLTDGFPILVANRASLNALNAQLKAAGKESIPMSRFRANIIVDGPAFPAFDEDQWKTVAIGDVLLSIVKGCPRCKQSCTDQETGQVTDEPLQVMKTFRNFHDQDVFFAQNAIVINASGATISVGDSVRVLERGEPIWKK